MPPSQGVEVSKELLPYLLPRQKHFWVPSASAALRAQKLSPKSICRDVQSDRIFETDGRTLVLEVLIPLEATQIKLGLRILKYKFFKVCADV